MANISYDTILFRHNRWEHSIINSRNNLVSAPVLHLRLFLWFLVWSAHVTNFCSNIRLIQWSVRKNNNHYYLTTWCIVLATRILHHSEGKTKLFWQISIVVSLVCGWRNQQCRTHPIGRMQFKIQSLDYLCWISNGQYHIESKHALFQITDSVVVFHWQW